MSGRKDSSIGRRTELARRYIQLDEIREIERAWLFNDLKVKEEEVVVVVGVVAVVLVLAVVVVVVVVAVVVVVVAAE